MRPFSTLRKPSHESANIPLTKTVADIRLNLHVNRRFKRLILLQFHLSRFIKQLILSSPNQTFQPVHFNFKSAVPSNAGCARPRLFQMFVTNFKSAVLSSD